MTVQLLCTILKLSTVACCAVRSSNKLTINSYQARKMLILAC
uniref:Uncharacterized protein n=1 Tax=Anguilla anguilla TaxID=7936 RepID=A0A0E9XNB1_ANGAN